MYTTHCVSYNEWSSVLFLAVVRILDLLEQMLAELKASRQILQFANPKAERLLEEEP